MRLCPLVPTALAALPTLLSAQQITDIALPPGTPQFQAVVFAADDALATLSASAGPAGAAVYRWTGLPGNPSLSITSLGALQPASQWYRLDERTAAYDATNGQVVLVRGLPADCVLVPTGLPTGSRLVAVNGTTAVHVRPQGFDVVRHDDHGAVVTFVPAPEATLTGSRHAFAPVNGDTLVGLAVGPDGLPGTADDRLLRLTGLAGQLAAVTVQSQARTATWAPEGFVVTPTGVGVAWRSPAIAQFDLEVLPLFGQAPAVLSSKTVGSYFGHQFGPWNYSVEVAAPNGLLLNYDDDLGTGKLLIRQLDGTPADALSWYHSSQFYSGEQLLDDRTLTTFDFITYYGFQYTRWSTAGASATIFVPEPCWTDLAFVAPNNQLVAAFADGSACSGPGSGQAVLTLDRLTPTGHTTQTFEMPGAWARHAAPAFGGRIHAFALGSSRVAGFVDSQAPAATPEVLRICSFALAAPGEAPGRRGGLALVALDIAPAEPAVSAPLQVRGTASTSLDPFGFLALGLGRTRPIDLAPVDALLHVDPNLLLQLVPMAITATPAGGSQTSLTLPAGLPTALVGLAFHCQLVVAAGGNVALSDLATITYGF